MKLKFSEIRSFLKNSFMAILKGEFLLRLNVGKYFIHIVYTFLLFVLVIWASLMVENSMVKVEKNKRTIYELQIENNLLDYQLSRIERSTDMADRLKALGSDVTEAAKPAATIKK